MKNFKKILRYLLNAGIFGYLFYQLYEIGFRNVISSLPVHPLFYLLFFVNYFSLPISEFFIYRVKWNIRFREVLPVLIRKKIFNADVLGYSGELYLFYWIRKKFDKQDVEIFHFIKDNNILSSVSSTLISVLLLSVFLTSGYLDIFDLVKSDNLVYFAAGGILLAIFAALAYRFRSYVFTLNRSNSLKISSIYTVRLIFTNIFQIMQWAVVKPEVPIAVWFSLMAVQIVSSRIPFLPSRDVLFVNIALGISPMVQLPQNELAGILAANLILKKIFSLLSFGFSFLKKNRAANGDKAESEQITALQKQKIQL